MTIMKLLTAAAAVSLMSVATPSFAQTDMAKDKAVDMAKDKAVDMAKDKAVDSIKQHPDGHIVGTAEAAVAGMVDDNTAVVADDAAALIQDKKGGVHIVQDITATKYKRSTDEDGNTQINATDVGGIIVSDVPASRMVDCPAGTSLQENNTCLITGDYAGH